MCGEAEEPPTLMKKDVEKAPELGCSLALSMSYRCPTPFSTSTRRLEAILLPLVF